MEEEEELEISSNTSETSSDCPTSENEQSTADTSESYLLIPYGFQSKAYYKPKSKSREITGVTYNSRTRQFIILDSKGVTAWSYNSVVNSVSRLLDYPSYQFNVIRLLLYSRKFNAYFALSKDYALKVFNINFHEVFSVVSDVDSILSMVFNSVTDELITGGTGGVKFWSFGEIKTKENSVVKDSRPMANYGLILRSEHPAMGGKWVKDIILDERNQKLYCLSERNVVAYDMRGNFLFQIKTSRPGFVTGCVYSKCSNFVVTGGTDCWVDVFSSNGGCIHSFSSHSKMVTNVLLHPETSSLVITSSQDGTIKIFSLDIMDEIYSHMVFAEGVRWMNLISSDLLYCATSKGLQVFSINHVANFWTTIRCPLKSLSLSGSCSKTQRVIAVAQDNSTRLLSRTNNLLSTVLPPPSITTVEHEKQFVRAHAYCRLYGLMYLLIDDKEIWVYYTKTNPANRVDVWQLSDVQDINGQKPGYLSDPRPTTSCTSTSETPRPGSTAYKRLPTSHSLYSCSKIVNDVSCLSLAFLDSPIMLNTDEGESCPDITYFLVAGLQDGRLLFLNPFSASLMYLQFQATKGAVVSIQHDDTHHSLLLNTITSNQFTIQIRRLPYLELEYQVNVGNDLKCFVRMDNTILSGHETGRLKLHHISSNTEQAVISDDEMRKSSDKKLSKDHLDAVLSVDACSDLQLFCSSSMDGCIKIWDNAKVLLREIIMDDSLTVVCFLNSSGDLLVGYKNHIFYIGYEKAHLSSYSKNTDAGNINGMFETASDVYEDPRIRYEFKKTSHPEPIRMETYLVPFANMSIDLARYLSGHPPPSALENDETSDKDETGSELSDLFSVAPTELYISQSGTPLSRSRSSSLASSWDLPNLGSSPVPSPPRTPPLVMTPLIEWESESEEEENTTALDDLVPAEGEDEQFRSLNWIPAKKDQKERKTAKVMPVISRRKRAGLSQVKIDSRSIRLKATLYSDKRGESENDTSGGHEGNTRGAHEENATANGKLQESIQSNLVRQAPRTVIKKTRKSVLKSTRRSFKSYGKLEQNDLPNPEFVQMDLPNVTESNEIGGEYEKAGNMVDETMTRNISREQDVENTRGNSSGNTRVPMKLHAMKTREEGQLYKKADSQKTLDKIGEERDFSNLKNEAPPVDELPATTPRDSSYINAEEQKEETTSVSLPSNTSTATTLLQKVEISGDRPCEQLHPGEEIPREDSDESDLAKEEFFTDEEMASCDTSTQTITEGENGKRISKTVSFQVSENCEGERQVSSKNVRTALSFHRIPHKSTRRSVSPVKPRLKVVSMSNPQLAKDKSGQRIHPSSALRIYALAKMHREPSSSVPLVSRPCNERRVRHYPSEESFSARDVQGVTDEELKRILGTSEDIRETLWTNTKQEKKEKPREKRDLVNWCINALRDKGQYPEFTPRPRLRSRRSMNFEKNEARAVVLRMKNPDDEHEVSRDRDLKDRKSEKARASSENEDWREGKPVIKCFSPSEMRHLKKTQVEEFCSPVSNVGICSEGWQDRLLEKDKALKKKRLERERKVLERRRADMDVLKEKRRSVKEQHEPRGTKQTMGDRLFDQSPHMSPLEEEPKKEKSWCSFENFKNNPQLLQPYRLRKFDSCTDEDTSWMTALQVDRETPYSADGIFDLLPRPKSAPSIPSKCRKYMLVASESEDIRNKPALSPLEETLMFKRFPKSKLKPRTASSIGSRSRRPHSVSKMQTSPISCE